MDSTTDDGAAGDAAEAFAWSERAEAKRPVEDMVVEIEERFVTG